MTRAELTKKKDFLICVDSEGCAIDSMNRKHMKGFGPCLVKEWNLENWNEAILERWNEYEYWVETTINHSIFSLKAELERTNSEIFKKALRWSEESDKAIEALSKELMKLFDGVKAALEYAHKYADIVVISTTDYDVAVDTLKAHGLDYVNVVSCENGSTKVSCIQELMKKGYAPSHILMVGDASEDMKAAQKNGIFFYPILAKQENDSWGCFVDTAVQRFINGEYAGPYQKYMSDRFQKNLTL